MAEPDVSIVTAAYDSAEHVERALKSVRRQTIDESRIEHVVVDDASTDETVSIVEGFDALYLRVVERDENSGGATVPYNRGIEAARGDFVVMLDADDEFLPTLVERMAAVLSENPDVDFVYSDYYERFPDGECRVVDTGADIMNTIRIGIMHRMDRLEAFDGYDPEVRFSEYDLLLRYLDAGLEGHHVPEPLFVYHRRRDSQTGDRAWVEEAETELRAKHGGDVEIRDYRIE